MGAQHAPRRAARCASHEGHVLDKVQHFACFQRHIGRQAVKRGATGCDEGGIETAGVRAGLAASTLAQVLLNDAVAALRQRRQHTGRRRLGVDAGYPVRSALTSGASRAYRP